VFGQQLRYGWGLFLLVAMLIVTAPVTAQSRNSSSHTYLTPLEEGVLNEINLARTNPKQYLSFLEGQRPLYHGKRFERPGEIPIVTQEGVAALDEAIHYLRSAKPVPPLDSSIGLSRAASDHATDQGRTGAMGHKGTDGSDPWDRMSRYGTWQRKAAENISYGSDNARDIVMQQVIDDGVHDREHRTNLFNPEFHFVGIGCEPHVRYRNVCVIDFAEGYSEKSRAGLR
jgi:uncharacterized protein YkwD